MQNNHGVVYFVTFYPVMDVMEFLEFLSLQYYVAYRKHTKINCFKTYKEWTVF